ncbi:MAG: hypothetical protein WAT19_06815 [Ferruginibacter sp.]
MPVLSTSQEALSYLDSVRTPDTSYYWVHVKPTLFYQNLRKNVLDPLSFYPGRSTNFCAYGALSYLVIHEDPLGYVKFMMQLYKEGRANYQNNHFEPSASVRNAAGELRFKGVLDVRHAEQMWFLSLADHFKGYLNIFNKKYSAGDENGFWAASNLAKFNRMVKAMTGYKTRSVGSDIIRPWVKNMVNYLGNRSGKGIIALYLNNRVIHKKNHDKIKLSIPTHFVILESIQEHNGVVTLVYWDYGGKTLLQVSPRVLKKIIFAVTFCTKD